MRIVRKESYLTTPWKNGGGLTREALRVPTAGDPFRWRISVAEISADGLFSDFAGYRRTMVLLRGAGVRLHFGDGRESCLSGVGDCVEFDGAVATRCELLEGGCVDLNLMVANGLRTRAGAVVEVKDGLTVAVAEGDTTAVFSLEGAVSLGTGVAPHRLGAWDLALLTAADGRVWIGQAGGGGAERVFLATIGDCYTD